MSVMVRVSLSDRGCQEMSDEQFDELGGFFTYIKVHEFDVSRAIIQAVTFVSERDGIRLDWLQGDVGLHPIYEDTEVIDI